MRALGSGSVLEDLGLGLDIEDPSGIAVHDRIDQLLSIGQTEPAFVDQLGQSSGDTATGQDGVAQDGLDRDVVAAKSQDFVGRGRDKILLEEVLAASGLMIQAQHMSMWALV